MAAFRSRIPRGCEAVAATEADAGPPVTPLDTPCIVRGSGLCGAMA